MMTSLFRKRMHTEFGFSWIFGLFFENAHKWKLHHWNPQEPRIQCIGIKQFCTALQHYSTVVSNSHFRLKRVAQQSQAQSICNQYSSFENMGLFALRGIINGKADKAAALPKFSDMLTLSQSGHRGRLCPSINGLALPHLNFFVIMPLTLKCQTGYV